MLQIISNIFNAEVRSFEFKDSAALGVALQPAHFALNNPVQRKTWGELNDIFVQGKVREAVFPQKEKTSPIR